EAVKGADAVSRPISHKGPSGTAPAQVVAEPGTWPSESATNAVSGSRAGRSSESVRLGTSLGGVLGPSSNVIVPSARCVAAAQGVLGATGRAPAVPFTAT